MLASALTDPMMNDAGTADQFRQVISTGGTGLVEAVADQEDVQNNINDVIQEGDKDPCDVPTFKKDHSDGVQNSDIADANNVDDRQMAGRPTIQWKDGVQWVSQGNGIQAQGNPFEVWDAQRLKSEGYFWLADYNSDRSNWRTFDEWNRDSQTAISDKTIDLNASTYKDRSNSAPPSVQFIKRIQGRLLADVQQMIRYDEDSGTYRYTTNVITSPTLSFAQNDIDHYVLDLGVPAEPTDSQWKAICQALQKANDRVTGTGKTIDFKVKDIG